MENKEIAIEITNLKKKYRLGQIGGGTLYGDLQSWWARIRGKEDPNSKIGAKKTVYGKTFMALDGIDLTVYKGEALGIIGHNGAGKSTLLKILSRVTAPTEGEIGINGKISSMLEVGTGFNMHMTGRENIYMNGAILGLSKAEIDAKMEDIIEFSEIREFIDTPVKRYSSGMYVKLAFSVASHLDSEIMIMDEVLAVGDMAFQKKCLSKMREIANVEGRTVLYVSHNMNTIRELCDRCVVMSKGKIVFVGEVEQAISVYMDTSGEYGAFYDYQNYQRPFNHSKELQFKSLKFIDREDNVWKKDQKVKANLNCEINENVKDVKLRFEIYSAKGLVAVMQTQDFISASKGEPLSLDLTFDAKGLAPSKYLVKMLAYKQLENHTQVICDSVERAFLFEIIDDLLNSEAWSSQYFGHVQLKDVKIEKSK